MTPKEEIQNLKTIYDLKGVPGATALFKEMLTINGEIERSKKVVEFLIGTLYKMDTCIEGCFEDIANKIVINCSCNGVPMEIPLINPFQTACIKIGHA